MGTKVPFVDIIKRITGISTPVFGISWEPPKLERDKAQELLTFLEDQRLLLGDYEPLLKNANYVEFALYHLRDRLTEELETLDRASSLAKSISAMRAACRKCLNAIQATSWNYDVGYDDPIGWIAMGELRAVFGLHIAHLCTQYGLDIEEELKSILPPFDEESAETEQDDAQ